MNAHSPNTGPNTAPSGDVDDEKPLDPATEKVRKKLVKFSAVFMGLNMVALMAVLGAIVYKIGGYGARMHRQLRLVERRLSRGLSA